MTEYVPTTENIRQTFAYVQAGLDDDEGYPFVMEFHLEAFDRWLEQHDIELMKEARNAYKKLEQAISDMQFKLPDGSDNVQLSYIIDEMHGLASAVHAWEGDYREETE